MTKKPNSPKAIKDLPHIKRIEELAADDYVDPESRSNFSDSDIHANEGVTVKNSDNESRELGASKTLAQDEDEEKQWRVAELQDKSMDWLHEKAQEFGIPNWSNLQKKELIQRLSDSATPAH